MNFLVNALLFVDAIVFFLLAYRLSWATHPVHGLSDENALKKRWIERTYWFSLCAQIGAMFAIIVHIAVVKVLNDGPWITPYLLVLGLLMAMGACLLYVKLGRTGIEQLH